MADFSIKATDLQDPQAAGSAPINPVRSPADVVPDLGNLGGLLTGLVDKKQKPWQALSTQYVKEMTTIQQARLTGQLSQAAAANRQAMVTVQYQKEGADYGPEFTKGLSDLRTQLGIGTRINANEDAVESDIKFNQGQLQEMQKMGLFTGASDYSAMSDSEQRSINQFVAASQNAKYVQDQAFKQWEQQAKMSAEGRSAGTWQRDADDYILKKQAQDAMGSRMSASVGIVDAQLTHVMNAQGLTDQQRQQTFELSLGVMKSEAYKELKEAPELYATYSQYLDNLSRIGRDLLDPTKKTAAKEDEWKRLITQAKIDFVMASPSNLKAAAISAVMPTNAPANLLSNITVMRYVGEDLRAGPEGRPLPSVVTGNTQTQQYVFKSTTDTINRVITGKESNPTKSLSDSAAVASSTVKAIGTFQPGSQNSMAHAVDFLASPEYGHLVKQKMFDANENMMAMQRMSDLYLPAVAGEVRKSMTQPIGDTRYEGGTPAAGNANLMNLIDFNVDDSGKITVVKKIDKEYRKGISASDVYIDRMIREANNNLGKDLTNTLRAGAHLEGRNDYKAYYAETAPALLKGFLAPSGAVLDQLKANGYTGSGNVNNPANWKGGKIPAKLENNSGNE